ncbi:MAG TPA: hypothetical protein VIK91_02555 [Nannocystis sp.]
MVRPGVLPSWCARFGVAAVLAVFTAPALVGCTSPPPPPPPPVETVQEVVLRYKFAPVRLRQDVAVTAKASGAGMEATADVALTGILDVQPIGTRFKVVHSVAEVWRAELSESLAPKPAPDEPPVDFKARIAATRGATIVDVRGAVEKEATKTLPERGEGSDFDLVGWGVLALPELPEAALVPGVPVDDTSREIAELVGVKFEIETTTTYTLRDLTEQDGRRIATVDIASEARGRQAQKGPGPIIGAERSGTVVFDVGAQLPLRSEMTMMTVLDFGFNVTAGISVRAESSYTLEEAGAAAPSEP